MQLWELPPDGDGDRYPNLEGSLQGEAAWPGYRKPFSLSRKWGFSGDVHGFVVVQPDRYLHPELYVRDIANFFHPPAQWQWPQMKRVWVVFTHVWDNGGHEVDKISLPEFCNVAQELGPPYQVEGAAVYLFEAPTSSQP
jgi:hypothetical protein